MPTATRCSRGGSASRSSCSRRTRSCAASSRSPEDRTCEPSVLGLFLTIFATFGMPFVGYFKWKTSRRLGSKGLAAEAKESIACSIDSALTLLAMIAGLLSAPGWVDPALSLLMVPWFLREGLAHVRGRVHAHVH